MISSSRDNREAATVRSLCVALVSLEADGE